MTNDLQQSSKPQFREATNLLRGICAFSVLIWHYQHFFYIGTDAVDLDLKTQPFFKSFEIFYRFGFQAVPIFWCISGLIMTHTYINSSHVSARNFLVSRIARLYPIHLLSLFAIAVLQIISTYRFSEFQIYCANDFYHFVLNLFFIQGWGFADGNSYNAQTWSVSVEVAVYIIFFLILKKLKKFKVLGALFVLSLCMSIDARFDQVVTELFFFECLIYFVTGILIFFVVKEMNKRTTKLLKSMINLAALLTLFVARYFDILLFDSGSNSWFWVLTYIVFLVSQIDGQIFTQEFKKLRIIGDLSYSVFLWHIPIQVFIKVVLHDSEIRDSYANSKLFFCFYLLLTYTVGYISHKFFEQPAQRFLRLKFMRPSRTG